MKIVLEQIEQKFELDVSKYSKRKIQLITIGIMFLSCFLGIIAYEFDSWLAITVGWIFAFISGQFYYIYENYEKLKYLR